MILEAVGWIGTIMVLLAYGLSNFSIISSHSRTYQLLNLFGALAIAIISWDKSVYQSVLLNAIWAFIAIGALLKSSFSKKATE